MRNDKRNRAQRLPLRPIFSFLNRRGDFLFIRFFLPLFASLGLLTLLIVPFSDRLVTGWLSKDLQLRSRLVASSVEYSLADTTTSQTERINSTLTRLTLDERLIGIAICTTAGMPLLQSDSFPKEISCDAPSSMKEEIFSEITLNNRPAMLAKLSSGNSGIPNYMMVVHDMTFVAKRSDTAQQYAAFFVLFISMLAAGVTLVVARLTIRGWISGIRKYFRDGMTGDMPPATGQLLNEVRRQMHRLEQEYIRSGGINAQWSADTLHDFVQKQLPSSQLIAVSYRQPYSHEHRDGKVAWSMPASGLVTALEPIMKACNGTWIAVSTGNADRDVVDTQNSVRVPPDNPAYKLKRIWLEKEEENGFYAGFANEGIWPLCCSVAYVKPHLRNEDWKCYQAVNRKFADAIVAEATSDRPIIFIQDYHFALLPQYIREKLPHALIVCFWHIPWPNSEVFGILPWRQEFLSGMLAADIIGFHTRYLCNNFLDCADTYVEALIDREHNTVTRGRNVCAVRPYPISIAWPEEPPSLSIAGCREKLFQNLHMTPGIKVLLGVERLDYVKGIPERLRAFELMLEKYPQWRGKVSFVQVASPSRAVIPAYAYLSRSIEEQVEKINNRFSVKGWQPIHLLKRNFSHKEVYDFYRAADVCVVSALHDGMNLVAKEFVAARDDNRGVLILSQFAGASRELTEALIINPYDEESMVSSFLAALDMSADEQDARMKSMREQVQTRNVYAWAGKILGDAARLYNRRELEDTIQKLNATAQAVPYKKRWRDADN